MYLLCFQVQRFCAIFRQMWVLNEKMSAVSLNAEFSSAITTESAMPQNVRQAKLTTQLLAQLQVDLSGANQFIGRKSVPLQRQFLPLGFLQGRFPIQTFALENQI